MAEAVGTALAVVGVLGQLFDGCVRAYGHFATAARFEGDARRLGCKVRIEEMRLLVWGRHWGVAEGRLEARLLREEEEEGEGEGKYGGAGVGGPALRRLALQILTELHQTITDVHRLRDRYGLAFGGDGGDGDGGDGHGNDEGGAKKKWGTGTSPHGALAVRPAAGAVNGTNNKPAKTPERSWRQELATRTKWVVAGMYRRAVLPPPPFSLDFRPPPFLGWVDGLARKPLLKRILPPPLNPSSRQGQVHITAGGFKRYAEFVNHAAYILIYI